VSLLKQLLLLFCITGITAIIAIPEDSLASEKAVFNSVGFPPSAFKQRQAKARGEVLEPKPGIEIYGHLNKPTGIGPHPALVLMHGCSGLDPAIDRWAATLNDAGYVTLQIDSFGPRGLSNICTDPMKEASPQTRALDAFGALIWLQDQRFVDPDRIGIIGWSHGGNSVLAAASNVGLTEKLPYRFKAAVAFYPYCFGGGDYQQPLLIIQGDKDDWAPHVRCKSLKKRSTNNGKLIELITYPDTYHGFDVVEFNDGQWGEGINGQKYWLIYNEKFHLDARDQVRLFLKNNL
jgi:dienelactone hydrolase